MAPSSGRSSVARFSIFMPASRLQALVDPAVAEIVQHMGCSGESSSAFFMSASALGHCLVRSSTMPRPKNTGQWRSSTVLDALDRRVVGLHRLGVLLLAAQQVGQGQRGVDAVGLLGDQRLAAG